MKPIYREWNAGPLQITHRSDCGSWLVSWRPKVTVGLDALVKTSRYTRWQFAFNGFGVRPMWWFKPFPKRRSVHYLTTKG